MSESLGTIYYEVDADTGRLINSSGQMDKSLGGLQKSFDKTDRQAGKFNGQMTKVAEGVKRANQQMDGQSVALNRLYKIAGAYLSLRTIQSIISMSDQYGQMASRIRNATNSANEYEKVQARLLETANGTYRSLNEAQEVYLGTADTLRDLGYTTEEVLDITDSFSYAMVRDAARADQARTAMDAYSKSLMRGRVEADAWASIMAATPSLVNGIADATGRTSAEIRQLGATGRLSLEALNEGLRRSRAENKAMADEMETSVEDAFIKLRNSIQLFIGRINESSEASGLLTDNIEVLSRVLQDPETIKAAQDLAGGIVAALNMIITTAKEVVAITRWMAEEVAATFHGAASDDIVRLENQLRKYQEMLENPLQRLRIGSNGRIITWMGEDEIRENLAATQKLIDAFYERESNRDHIQVPRTDTEEQDSSNERLVQAESNTRAVAEADRERARAEREVERATSANADAVHKLEQALLLAALSGQELVVKQAELSLNEYATPEQIQKVKELAADLYAVQEAAREARKFGDSPQDAWRTVQGDISPLSGGMFDQQYARYEAEAQLEQQRFDDAAERLRKARELQRDIGMEYDEAEEKLKEQHNARMKQIDQARYQVMLQSGEQAFGAMADVIRTARGEQSRAYKVMFALSKAFAIANSAVQIQGAIANAWNLPFPANLAAVGTVITGTAGIVSAIQSVHMAGGRQYGGPVAAGSMYRVNEDGRPEVFRAANGQQFMIPNSRGEVVSNKDASGSGSATVVNLNIVESQERGGEVERSDGPNGNVTITAFVADIRRDGPASKALSQTFGLKRRGK